MNPPQENSEVWMTEKQYRLVGPDGREHLSTVKGSLGGNGKSKLYGRLDRPAARRALGQGT